MSPRLAIIGASSMIASQACTQFENAKAAIVKGDLGGPNPIDITSADSTANFFQKNSFDWAVLFAGYTDVNGAEAQRDDKKGTCWQINVEGVKNVVDACKKYKRKLIFISTDFVFDGQGGPYGEDDKVGGDLKKVGWYGITKLEGEKYIKANLAPEDFLIIRISFPYSGKNAQKADFLIKILDLHKQGKLYPMYTDQVFTPTYIPDPASAILALLDGRQNGVFHLASPQTTTPYDFAKYLLTGYGKKEVHIEKGSLESQLSQFGAVPRPVKGGLKTQKIAEFFKPTAWKDGIDKALSFWLK